MILEYKFHIFVLMKMVHCALFMNSWFVSKQEGEGEAGGNARVSSSLHVAAGLGAGTSSHPWLAEHGNAPPPKVWYVVPCKRCSMVPLKGTSTLSSFFSNINLLVYESKAT